MQQSKEVCCKDILPGFMAEGGCDGEVEGTFIITLNP